MLTSSYEEMMAAKKFIPIVVGYLPENIVEKAKKELNETDEVRNLALIEMRKLVLAEKKWICPSDDAYLLQYLRARKFDVKRAFQLLQTYYHVKKEYPECYTNFDFVSLGVAARSGGAYCLNYRSTDGCAVLVIEFSDWNCIETDMVVGMRLLTFLLLYSTEEPFTQVCGWRVLCNIRGLTLRHIRAISPRLLHLLSKALRNCMPCRFKGIHIINESFVFHYIWSILKIFLSEKIKKRVHFHGDNLKQMYKYLPKEILPEMYGGTNSNFNPGEWCANAMNEFQERAEMLLDYGYTDD